MALRKLLNKILKKDEQMRLDSFLARFQKSDAISLTLSTQSDTYLGEEEKRKRKLWERFVIDPAGKWYYHWLMIIAFSVVYNWIALVARGCFNELQKDYTLWWLLLDYLSDGIYIVDMGIRLHTGFLEQGLLITDYRKLYKTYLKSLQFKLDILSILPTDFIHFAIGIEHPEVRFNRLLRFSRAREFFARTETRTTYPNVFRISHLLFYTLIIIHWNACIYYAISKVIGFGEDTWVYPNISDPEYGYLTRQYVYCFYWSMLTLFTIGDMPQPVTDEEYIFVIFDFLVGVFIFATIVGSVGSMICNMNATQLAFKARSHAVKHCMQYHNVSKKMEAKVIKWFEHIWTNRKIMDEWKVFKELPNKLRADVTIDIHLDMLKKVRLFFDCEARFLEELVVRLHPQIFSPGDYICRKGDIGKEMYFIMEGKLAVVADDGVTKYALLTAGCCFGEISILNIKGNKMGNRRIVNIRSIGYAELFCLSKEDLMEVVAYYPKAKSVLIDRGQEYLMHFGLLGEEAKAETSESMDFNEKLGWIESRLSTFNTRFSCFLDEYGASQMKLLKFVYFLKTQVKKQSLARHPIGPPGVGTETKP